MIQSPTIRRYVVIASVVWTLLASLPIAQTIDNEDDKGAELSAVLAALQESLKEAQQNNVPGFPPLKSATITLQTIATVEKGVSFKFLVFSIETKSKTEKSSSVILKMTPPPTTELKGFADIDPAKLKHALAKAINLAKVGTVQANTGTPKLDMNNVKIEIRFAVSVGVAGGVEIAELLPVGVKGTGRLDANHIHSVALEFGRKE